MTNDRFNKEKPWLQHQPVTNASSPEPVAPRPELTDELPRQKQKKGKKKDKGKNGLGSLRGIETMFRTSYRQHVDLSALADNKGNIMITINGIVISIVLASISPKIDANPWLLIPTMVLLLSCLVSMAYAVLAARPRVTSTPPSDESAQSKKANILFFSNFVHLSEDQYVGDMTELLRDTDQLYRNMLLDIYNLGHVLSRKFKLLRVSYTVFIIGITAGVLLYLVVFTGVVLSPPEAAIPTTVVR